MGLDITVDVYCQVFDFGFNFYLLIYYSFPMIILSSSLFSLVFVDMFLRRGKKKLNRTRYKI